MRRLLALLILLIARTSAAQQFPIDTLLYHGGTKHHINVVILGDGFTSSEQQTFVQDARDLSNYLLGQPPWSHYQQYFNVFAIEVPSQESGTSHPNTAPDCAGSGVPTITVTTAFGCSFDAFGIHRLVVPANQVAIAHVLANNFPNYDQVLMVAHSPYYGGSGGEYATATVNTSSAEIVAHEIGHSFAGLADEYWAGPQYAAEKPNMTKESSPTLIRWKNWLTAGTGIGIYPHTGDPTWFKPSDGCKMQLLGVPYCAVCSEAIVERIHDLVKPIVAYSPHAISVDVTAPVTFALDTVLRPDPNTLRITWSVDGVVKQQQATTFLATSTLLGLGTHSLVAAVVDTGALVRADRHFTAHEYSVTWNVTVSASTVIESRTNDLRLDVYPNPASSALHVAVESERAEPISVQIIAENGEVLAAFATTSTSHYSHTFDLQALPHGSYAVLLSTPDGILRRGFVRN